eukprot:6172404-Pleurochrysis_carterae.AAC.1
MRAAAPGGCASWSAVLEATTFVTHRPLCTRRQVVLSSSCVKELPVSRIFSSKFDRSTSPVGFAFRTVPNCHAPSRSKSISNELYELRRICAALAFSLERKRCRGYLCGYSHARLRE